MLHIYLHTVLVVSGGGAVGSGARAGAAPAQEQEPCAPEQLERRGPDLMGRAAESIVLHSPPGQGTSVRLAGGMMPNK